MRLTGREGLIVRPIIRNWKAYLRFVLRNGSEAKRIDFQRDVREQLDNITKDDIADMFNLLYRWQEGSDPDADAAWGMQTLRSELDSEYVYEICLDALEPDGYGLGYVQFDVAEWALTRYWGWTNRDLAQVWRSISDRLDCPNGDPHACELLEERIWEYENEYG